MNIPPSDYITFTETQAIMPKCTWRDLKLTTCSYYLSASDGDDNTNDTQNKKKSKQTEVMVPARKVKLVKYQRKNTLTVTLLKM